MIITPIRVGLLALLLGLMGSATSLAGGAGGAGGAPITVTDLLRLRTVSSIDVAADGSRAVIAVHSVGKAAAPAKERERDRNGEEPSFANQSHLYLLDLVQGSTAPRQLTFGDRRDRSPRLSPDGRHIAFVRGGEERDSRTSQVWILRVDGGEARQVTDLEHGATSPVWSPDGRSLLVRSMIPMRELGGTPPWPAERPKRSWNDTAAMNGNGVTPRPDGTRAEIRAWLERNATENDPHVIHRIDFQDEQKLRGEMRFSHLFLVDVDNQDAAPRRITHGFFQHEDAAFLPDGDAVVFVTNRRIDAHPDRVLTNELWIADIGGGEPERLLTIDGWRLREPKPSRDGTVIAFLGQNRDEPAFRPWQLGLAPLDRDDADELSAASIWITDQESFDASIQSFEWMHARASLLFTSVVEGAFPMHTISPGLLKPSEIIGADNGMPVGVHAFGAGGGAIVYALTSPANPCTVRVRDARGDRLAFDLNEWVHEKKLSLPAGGWLNRPDGTRVQYWVMEPTNHEDGQQYPLCLQIHGGPSAMWGPGELSMWHEFQLLCAWGYGVVYANPRGSTGYGYEFQKANFQNWGDGPAGDVLAAVDQALLLDWVDRDRLVVTGGSYAGYLTAWIIAHDHRFKAAVAQRGVYHLPTFYGEGNAWRLVRWAMGGSPMDARVRTILERESPFTYVQRIRTPLLIMHASQDLRTGVSQSEMFYRALKDLGRPVEYVRYPDAGHDLSRSGDPIRRMDRLNRIIEFFERYIDNPRPAPQP